MSAPVIKSRNKKVEYVYIPPTTSPFYKGVVSPVCDLLCLNLVPEWVHPDILTVFGGIAAIAAALIAWLGQDCSLTFASVAVIWIMYSLLDNMDGKQARRTKQSSASGEYLDHTVDSFVVCLATVVWRRALCDFNPVSWQVCIMVLAGQLPVFVGHWAHNIIGRLLLGASVSGYNLFTVDEFNLLYLPTLCAIRAFCPAVLLTRFLDLSEGGSEMPAFIRDWKLIASPLQDGGASLGAVVMWLMVLFCSVGAIRIIFVVGGRERNNGIEYLISLLPMGIHIFLTFRMAIPPLRSIWAFTMICAEMLASRLTNSTRTCLWTWVWVFLEGSVGLISVVPPWILDSVMSLCGIAVAIWHRRIIEIYAAEKRS